VIKVPFVNLAAQFIDLEAELTAAFLAVGRSGQFILGSEVSAFEAELSPFCGGAEIISVANATDALTLVMKVMGIGAGDEVITAPNSFIASAGSIAMADATIRFADVGPDFNIDPAAIEAAISPATKAIIPVHLTGNPADMDAIMALAEKHKLFVIEDAAQAIGATYRGRAVGALGHAACFSLHPLKNLGLMGDAGFISTTDKVLAENLRRQRNHGLINRDESVRWGINSRLDALQAAMGRVKLRHLPDWTKRFQEIARRYRAGLQDVAHCPTFRPDDSPVYHNFVLRIDRRDAVMAALLERGVETKIHYPIPLHLMAAAASLGYGKGSFPATESQAARIMSLPIYPELTDAQIDYVIESVRAVLAV
jgi:dTDP-4-amino-4,6-dideoxygalactose transaminase